MYVQTVDELPFTLWETKTFWVYGGGGGVAALQPAIQSVLSTCQLGSHWQLMTSEGSNEGH